MKSFYLFICLIFGLVFPKSQVKFHNITFPYFETKKIVKPSNTIKSTNRLTKKLMQIVEYNQFGQQHGTTIIYRNDGSPSSLNYFHNGKRVYQAIPFQNSFNIQKVFNYDDSGNFDGTQSYTYLNNDDNKWHQIKFNFKIQSIKVNFLYEKLLPVQQPIYSAFSPTPQCCFTAKSAKPSPTI